MSSKSNKNSKSNEDKQAKTDQDQSNENSKPESVDVSTVAVDNEESSKATSSDEPNDKHDEDKLKQVEEDSHDAPSTPDIKEDPERDGEKDEPYTPGEVAPNSVSAEATVETDGGEKSGGALGSATKGTPVPAEASSQSDNHGSGRKQVLPPFNPQTEEPVNEDGSPSDFLNVNKNSQGTPDVAPETAGADPGTPDGQPFTNELTPETQTPEKNYERPNIVEPDPAVDVREDRIRELTNERDEARAELDKARDSERNALGTVQAQEVYIAELEHKLAQRDEQDANKDR